MKVNVNFDEWNCCPLFETETVRLLERSVGTNEHTIEVPLGAASKVLLLRVFAPILHVLLEENPLPKSVTSPPLEGRDGGAIADIRGTGYWENETAGLNEDLSVVRVMLKFKGEDWVARKRDEEDSGSVQVSTCAWFDGTTASISPYCDETHQYLELEEKPIPEKVIVVPPVAGPLEGLIASTLKKENPPAMVPSVFSPLKERDNATGPDPGGDTQTTWFGDKSVPEESTRSKKHLISLLDTLGNDDPQSVIVVLPAAGPLEGVNAVTIAGGYTVNEEVADVA
jgi:hypothetical protein